MEGVKKKRRGHKAVRKRKGRWGKKEKGGASRKEADKLALAGCWVPS